MYPIPRCDDAIEDLDLEELVTLLIWFLVLDCRKGVYQLWIKLCDQEETDFFTPDGDKECYQVMSSGLMNTPDVYTAMMYEFKKEWEDLFTTRFPEAVCNLVLRAISRNIVDDILTLCTDPHMLCDLFQCICIVFQKYRVSLQLDT
jgi:hypothetical protein